MQINTQKIDILVICAHPDDAELCCGGTILSHIAQGYKVGIIDLTEGELGTRGTIQTRYEEAKNASEILGISLRENLQMADGFFENDKSHQLKIIQKIRDYQPQTVLTNALEDRHTDHSRASKLVADACFLAGLQKIETFDTENNPQNAWRPKNVYHFIQDFYNVPQFVVDVTPFWERKMEAIRAFKTQFFVSEDEAQKEPATPISTPDFMYFLEARAREMGRIIGVTFGEGFCTKKALKMQDLVK
jgi:N-acetylglucosamine malate deacetylase 1